MENDLFGTSHPKPEERPLQRPFHVELCKHEGVMHYSLWDNTGKLMAANQTEAKDIHSLKWELADGLFWPIETITRNGRWSTKELR